MAEPWGAVRPIVEADAVSGFRCGKHALDDYLARHALSNDRSGVIEQRSAWSGIGDRDALE